MKEVEGPSGLPAVLRGPAAGQETEGRAGLLIRELRPIRGLAPILPAGTVAALAALLQLAVLLTVQGGGSGLGLPGAALPLGGLDYTQRTIPAIPVLEPSFVARVLGRELRSLLPFDARTPTATGPERAPNGSSKASPAPVPPPLASPSPRPSPLIPGAASVHPSMRANKTTARPGDELLYTIEARNDGDQDFTGAFLVNTHTPLGTAACTTAQGDLAVCLTPGEYDGTSQAPDDPHLNPAQQERVMTVPAHETRVVYTLRVQVASAAPGFVLHNHAHVDVVGDGAPAQTYAAPDVVVS